MILVVFIIVTLDKIKVFIPIQVRMVGVLFVSEVFRITVTDKGN